MHVTGLNLVLDLCLDKNQLNALSTAHVGACSIDLELAPNKSRRKNDQL